MEPTFSLLGQEGDSSVDFYLSSDAMYLTADFFPAEPGGKLLVGTEIESILQSQGINQGIQYRHIQEAVFECNTRRRNVRGVRVAEGTPPVKEVPAYWRLEPGLFQEKQAQTVGLERLDFKEIHPYVIVHERQILARAVAPIPGVNGVTVTGNVVPFGKKSVVKLLPGHNTLIHSGSTYAKIAGRLVQAGGYFHVEDYLEVEAVDYTTGHIDFPGHVNIKRNVLEGFRVHVGRDLKVGDTLDATDIFVRGGLTVHGGILGRKRGLVRVGGDLHADFLENTLTEVLGNAAIRKAILQSEVLVNGDFTMGESGRIVNSFLCVKGCCYLNHVGNESHGARVSVGIDFVVKRKADRAKTQLLLLENEKLAWETRLPIAAMAQEKIHSIDEQIQALVAELNLYPPQMIVRESVLRVKGTVYAGSVLEMGFASLEVRENLTGRQFRLGEEGHSILIEAWTVPKV